MSQYGKKIKFEYFSTIVEHKKTGKLKIVFIKTKDCRLSRRKRNCDESFLFKYQSRALNRYQSNQFREIGHLER